MKIKCKYKLTTCFGKAVETLNVLHKVAYMIIFRNTVMFRNTLLKTVEYMSSYEASIFFISAMAFPGLRFYIGWEYEVTLITI